jgi:FMN phosphatase YigB (HAD superfamily)
MVLQDLDFPLLLNPVVLSEEEGFEKPCTEIFLRAISKVSQKAERQDRNPIKPEECLHVGDELESWVQVHDFSSLRYLTFEYSDYNGALAAGMKALLLRRSGPDGKQAHKPPQEQEDVVQTVKDLGEVIQWVKNYTTGQ